jgi:hypothetical protein
MTEAEWLASSDPKKMLTYLRNNVVVSDRELRLFALECYRRVAGRFPAPRNLLLLQMAELLVDVPDHFEAPMDELAGCAACHPDSIEAALNTADFGARAIDDASENTLSPPEGEAAVQAAILREIIGNPFAR